MSNKQLNWGKWASIITVVATLAAFAGWGWSKAFSASLGNLPDKVTAQENELQEHENRLSEHDKRLNSLEQGRAIDNIIISNSFGNIEQRLIWIQKHMTNNYNY